MNVANTFGSTHSAQTGMCRENQTKGNHSQLWSVDFLLKNGLIKMHRQAVFTGNNNVSGPWCGSVPARRPGGPSHVFASGDLERRLAYSEVFPIRLSILILTDVLDAALVAMNKCVGVFAGWGQVSSLHHGFTVSVIPAKWLGIIVLGQEVFVPGVVLRQGRRGHTQTQHEDQHQRTQAHDHLFQQRLLPRAKGCTGFTEQHYQSQGPWQRPRSTLSHLIISFLWCFSLTSHLLWGRNLCNIFLNITSSPTHSSLSFRSILSLLSM